MYIASLGMIPTHIFSLGIIPINWYHDLKMYTWVSQLHIPLIKCVTLMGIYKKIHIEVCIFMFRFLLGIHVYIYLYIRIEVYLCVYFYWV